MRDTRRRRLVLVVLLLVSLTLIALGGGSSGPGKALRSVGGTVFGPVQRAVAAVWNPVHDFFGGLGRDDQARLEALERENDRLRLLERSSEHDHTRAQELDDLLKIAGLGRYRVVAAQVIAVGAAQGFADTVLLDAGTIDGLKVGMTVINGDGLVGRVKTVTSGTATVVLAIDPSFVAPIRVAGTNELGWATGGGRDLPMSMRMFDSQAVLKPGAAVVTSQDPNFPGGVPVGTIVDVQGAVGSLNRGATLAPYVDFTSIDVVGVVIVPPRTDPRDSVLPSSPAPTPTPAPTGTPAATASPSGTATSSPRSTATPRPSASKT